MRPTRSRLAAWAAVLVTAALVVWLWPTSLGGCTTIVHVSGGSMEPTIAAGDLLVARCGETTVGDVVVYEPPTVPGARVVHRVVGGDAAGWELQGDANDWLDPWRPDEGHVLGRVVLHVPGFGLTGWLLDPLPWLSLAVIGAGLFVWPVRGTDEEGEPSRSTRGMPVGPRGARAVGAAAAVGAVAMMAMTGPAPAAAARTDLSAQALLAWTQTVDVAPELPVASCSTTDRDLPCTVEIRKVDVWGTGFNAYLEVSDARTGSSDVEVPWTVTLDLSAAPFPWVPNGLDAAGFVARSTCADLPLLVVAGQDGWGDYDHLGPGDTREVWIQGHRDGSGILLACG